MWLREDAFGVRLMLCAGALWRFCARVEFFLGCGVEGEVEGEGALNLFRKVLFGDLLCTRPFSGDLLVRSLKFS